MRRRAFAWLCCAALGAVGVGIAAGQSGGGKASPAHTSTPACAHAAKTVDRPAEVPAALLPPATTLTSTRHLAAGTTLVTGVIDRGLRAAVEFYVTDLPAAGYQNGRGDAEMAEAEALFSGNGVIGKWKLNAIPDCPDAVTLALFVKR
jgi:hypothetical protein